MSIKLLVILFCAVVVNSVDIPEQHTGRQTYKVKGVFFCGDKPAKDVRVKLVDDDFGPDPDDEMDAGYTDEEGKFELSGFTTEMTTIDPHLKVYHDCDDNTVPCQRRWKFELPNHYISTDEEASPKMLDIGKWNLEGILPGESRDCLH